MEPNLVEDPGTRTAGRATTAAWSLGLPMGEDHGCPAGGRRAPGLPGRRNAVATRTPAGRMPRWRPLGRAGPRARGRERAAVAVREVPRRRVGRARRDPVVVAAAAPGGGSRRRASVASAGGSRRRALVAPAACTGHEYLVWFVLGFLEHANREKYLA